MENWQPKYTNPFEQFDYMYRQAIASGHKKPDAFMLATCTQRGEPSLRTLLLKGVEQCKFCFYTNYDSQKGRELEENPNAVMNFYWPNLEYQIRISGFVERMSSEDSKRYFYSRPKGSQFSAAVSPQGKAISDRLELVKKRDQLVEQVGSNPVPFPSYWGGYYLTPLMMEFWVAGDNRLHHRFSFKRNSSESDWQVTQLAP